MQFKYLRHDLYRYFYPNNEISERSFFGKLKIVVYNQGIWAIVVYRFIRWVIFECRIPLIRPLLKIVGGVLELMIQVTTGIDIQPGCDIGPGLYIGHYGSIFLPNGVKIGKFCNISHENTIGVAGRNEKRGLPEIGDFVYICPGAKIIGKIKIGSNVAIGANAVVTKDLPDNAVAVGVPAKIISYNSSRDFIEFNEEKGREFL
mgnify:CR=1 FL=1